MRTLNLKSLEEINGGAKAASSCDAGDIFDIGFATVAVIGIFVFPPSAFWTVPAATAAGLGLGKAISDCVM